MFKSWFNSKLNWMSLSRVSCSGFDRKMCWRVRTTVRNWPSRFFLATNKNNLKVAQTVILIASLILIVVIIILSSRWGKLRRTWLQSCCPSSWRTPRAPPSCRLSCNLSCPFSLGFCATNSQGPIHYRKRAIRSSKLT